LPTAIRDQLVTASFKSRGCASGDCIEIDLERRDQGDLSSITVPPGLVLANSTGSQQDMALLQVEGELSEAGASTYTPTSEMRLSAEETTAQFIVKAFCAALHKDNPTEAANLTLREAGSPTLTSLMQAMRSEDPPITIAQVAVWVVTDNATRADLSGVGYGVSDADVQQVRQILTKAGLNPENYVLTA
jgi:hypothetical protein